MAREYTFRRNAGFRLTAQNMLTNPGRRYLPAMVSLNDALACVAEFHAAFGIPEAEGPVTAISAEEAQLRHRLMAEENDEYLAAAAAGDLVEVADALGDQLYILCGTLLRHGLGEVIGEVFLEIQRSNMSKLGPDGRPLRRPDGKVLKGPDWSPPAIAPILERHVAPAR